MKQQPLPGMRHEQRFVVPDTKTVPHLYPESEAFRAMPGVFATGFLVGFVEWACIEAMMPYLDWPAEQTVGTHMDISHEAATPPGLTVTAVVELVEIDGNRLEFSFEANDGIDVIARGRHQRFVINREKFDARLQRKQG